MVSHYRSFAAGWKKQQRSGFATGIAVLMHVQVQFWSYFTELAGTNQVVAELPLGSKVEELLHWIYQRHPRLAAMRNSTLVAVGVDYQGGSYELKDGYEVSLFPPVQGG